MTSAAPETPVPPEQEPVASPPRLDTSAGHVTIINTYSVTPERADELLDALVQSATDILRFAPGFISTSLHVSLDRTRLVNYSQWRDSGAIAAAGADPEIASRIRAVSEIADSFAPVLYELRHSVSAISAQPKQRS